MWLKYFALYTVCIEINIKFGNHISIRFCNLLSNLLETAEFVNQHTPDWCIQFCPNFVDVKKFLPMLVNVHRCVLPAKQAIYPWCEPCFCFLLCNMRKHLLDFSRYSVATSTKSLINIAILKVESSNVGTQHIESLRYGFCTIGWPEICQ